MSDRTLVFRAQWVIPVSQPPIENGFVEVRENTIVSVGQGTPPPGELRDLGHAAILPGLVNAHTHLEFSLLEQPLGQPGISFPDWLRRVIAYRRDRDQQNSENQAAAIDQGMVECRRVGTALIGEITSQPWPLPTSTPCYSVCFLEQLGLLPGLVADRFESVSQRCDASSAASAGCATSVGLSPHAPYSVHRDLLWRLMDWAGEKQLPLAIHLAETKEEIELLGGQANALSDFLKDMGVWSGFDAFAQIEEILNRLPQTGRHLLIHGHYFDETHWSRLATMSDRISVVYCPRTHRFFGHDPYPLSCLIARGIPVAIGTDSRASNPDLSVWKELQTIANLHPDLPPHQIIRLGTLNGAWALNRDTHFGSLTPGKRAALNFIPFPSSTPALSLWSHFFAGNLCPIFGVPGDQTNQ